MAFKIYFNKKTRHPSISLSGKDKTRWENMEMTHHPTKRNSYIDIVCVSPNNGYSKSYVRKYIRKDGYGAKGRKLKQIKMSDSSEASVKNYIKQKHKKR